MTLSLIKSNTCSEKNFKYCPNMSIHNKVNIAFDERQEQISLNLKRQEQISLNLKSD